MVDEINLQRVSEPPVDARLEGARGYADPNGLEAAIVAVLEALPLQTPAIIVAQRRLRELLTRLNQGQLQIAVVGQFKRGKSTLINALIGDPLLPAAVTPLTAIPTFLRYGDKLDMSTTTLDGHAKQMPAATVEGLRSLLRQYVTEEGNPHNRAGIARVDAFVQAPLLDQGVTLIDTPGVGSTHRHNTETAHAILPESDMAIFVVSPDPPITEIELSYLEDIRRVASEIVVVLNKVDIVEGVDRQRSEQFLENTLHQSTDLSNCRIFCISARAALAAKLSGNQAAVATSGLAALESFLSDFIHLKRRDVLREAIGKKVQHLVNEIIFELESRLAVLRMPVADLSERLLRFDAAGHEFRKQRQTSRDILTGDKTRLLSEIDLKTIALKERALEALLELADAWSTAGRTNREIAEEMEKRVPDIFQCEFERLETETQKALQDLLRVQQEAGDTLIADIRKTAARLLDIPYRAPPPEDAFQSTRTPYWVSKPRTSLVLDTAFLDVLLSPASRQQRMRRRLKARVEEAITINAESLRWAIRQNIERSIGTFQAALDDRLAVTQAATRTAMETGLGLRRSAECESRAEVARVEEGRDRLKLILTQLEGII